MNNLPVYQSWKAIKPLGRHSWLAVFKDGSLGVLHMRSYPATDQDVLDLLQQGLTPMEIEELGLHQVKAAEKAMNTTALLASEEEGFAASDFTLENSRGEWGWKICFVQPCWLPLKEYARYNVFDLVKAESLLKQLTTIYARAVHAGLLHGHICKENIFALGQDQFVISDFSLRNEQPDLKQDLQDLLNVVRELIQDHPDYPFSILRVILDSSYEDPWQLLQILSGVQE